MIKIKNEEFYGVPKGYVYEDNLSKLDQKQVDNVLKFRAGEELFQNVRYAKNPFSRIK